mgnify:CR=1 FL=1
MISIHASRGGSDPDGKKNDGGQHISIHASRGGSDVLRFAVQRVHLYFNPRFPWGKRPQLPPCSEAVISISIHASRGGSDRFTLDENPFVSISIHASRGGSDYKITSFFTIVKVFQSTLPVGEATLPVRRSRFSAIHFNPRFPWGKRRSAVCGSTGASLFQSTLPVGEATFARLRHIQRVNISIHASRGGSDLHDDWLDDCEADFNPRFPWGKRRG